MEISIFALEKLIDENAQKIANCSKQMKDLDAGTITLSPMKLASVENTLEEANKSYETYQKLYDEIPQDEKDKQKELVRVQEALAKQSYYKLQKIRLKRNKNLKRNQRLEAMMIIDELPDDIDFDDRELIEISSIVIKNNIREASELEKDLIDIKNDFDARLESLDDGKDLKHFTFLDTYIPIIILHFNVLVQNIQETIEQFNENAKKAEGEVKLLTFRGLPKYEDWWIEELFKNHQAYFGLYKWKDIIHHQCMTEQQQIIWDKIFNNWLMVKKILNSKDENGYDYNYVFDDMIQKYVELEEELDSENLQSMEKIILNITKKEDFTKMKAEHNIITTYVQWKINRLKS
ncbi:MAG: hypothetical protein KAJ49_00550 [Arcobacteraceae bacterium]|nr:hypothetical protein [Arcobacteraceae bacterium]